MICDNLTEDDIYEAFMIYASLHGLSTEESSTRKRIADYTERNIPDEVIDDAILAFLEDRIVAPPDVVLAMWGSSRFYELSRSGNDCFRHQVCESWFENGCRLTEDAASPPIVHFWTEFTSTNKTLADSGISPGVRVRFELETLPAVRVAHRNYGDIGYLQETFAASLHAEPLRSRQFLPLVDKVITGERGDTCRLLVTTAIHDVPISDLVAYCAEAFHAPRTKC